MGHTITSEEFEALYRAVAPELLGYIRRQVANDAEDLVAEIFTTAWRRRSDLPSAMLHRAWLFGTARRLVLASGRQAQNLHTATSTLSESPSEERDQDSSTEQIVLEALARLSPGDREVIQLVEWDRLTPAELAVALGIRPGTARVRLHRARQALASDPHMQALVRRTSTAPSTSA